MGEMEGAREEETGRRKVRGRKYEGEKGKGKAHLDNQLKKGRTFTHV